MRNLKVGQEQTRRPQIRVISWRLVVCLFLVISGITAATTLFLVRETSSQTPDEAKIASVEINAIRTGLSVGVGAGGAAALLLAARKQWLGERSQLHQEEVAETEIMDATERRITDLYGKAVDQLGSDIAPVRIGGIFALERLAQANPSHRQTIIDVVCAYLRMPFSIPSSVEASSVTTHALQTALANNEERQEMQVRITAQDLLRRHLSNTSKSKGEFWGGLRIDLTGATLITWNLSDCELEGGVFAHTRFIGTTRFTASKSTGFMKFRGARFHGFADFKGFEFSGPAKFEEVTFERACGFDQASFDLGARFDRSTFKGQASFKLANFYDRSNFDDAEFSSEVNFAEADFASDVQFIRAIFADICRFGQVRFRGAVTIADSDFKGMTRFGSSRFEGRLRLRGTHFMDSASFSECKFTAGVSVRNTRFSGVAKFANIEPMDGAAFRDVTFEKSSVFAGTQRSTGVSFYGSQFNGTVEFHRTVAQSYHFDNSSVLSREKMRARPVGWAVSDEISASGRYDIVRWHPPMLAPVTP
ncbi:pentapeptide repeat-containing protein [Streptomyces sp. NPDC060027]|uniref:pentapeptide repeat-containing protein n=1 Tax=Streptomyces sp. NPDC060027 TaxID=3347040 RepID=UPI0036A78B88